MDDDVPRSSLNFTSMNLKIDFWNFFHRSVCAYRKTSSKDDGKKEWSVQAPKGSHPGPGQTQQQA